MAKFLVLENFKIGFVRSPAGSILDDDQVPVEEWRRAGLADVPYDEASMEDVRQIFLSIRNSGRPETENDLFTLLARDPQASAFLIAASLTSNSEPLTFYVDSVLGDDQNGGRAELDAFATIGGAISKIPKAIRFPVVIKVKPGIYECPDIGPYDLSASIYIEGIGVLEQIAPSAAQAGSSATGVVTAGGLVVDAHVGQTVEMLSGAAAGDRRLIRSNTDTTIMPVRAFSAAIQPGDQYRVFRPEVQINTASRPYLQGGTFGDQGGGIGIPRPNLYFVNLRFISTAVPGDFSTAGSICFLGCEIDFTSFSIPIFGGSIFAGQDADDLQIATGVANPVADLGARDATAWIGWGLSVTGNFFSVSSPSEGSILGFFVGPGIICNGKVDLRGGRLFGLSNSTPTLQVVSGECSLGSLNQIPCFIDSSANNSRAALVTKNAYLEVVEAEVMAEGTLSDSIVAENGGVCFLSSNGALAEATRYGLHSRRGGRIMFVSGVTVSGDAADTSINDGAVTSPIGTYNSGDFIDQGDGSVVQRE